MSPKKGIAGPMPTGDLWESLFHRATLWQACPWACRLPDPVLYAELIDMVAAGCPLIVLASAAIAFIRQTVAGESGKAIVGAIDLAGGRIDADPALAARLRRNFVRSLRQAQAEYAESGDACWIVAIAAVSVWRLRHAPNDVARCYLRSAN